MGIPFLLSLTLTIGDLGIRGKDQVVQPSVESPDEHPAC
jgi:hypothetical protein